MRLAFAEVAGDQDGDAHRELGHDEGNQVQDLAAGRHRGQAGRGAEAANHEEVDGTVRGLQHERAENRQHERHQLLKDAALGEIILIIHIIFSF